MSRKDNLLGSFGINKKEEVKEEKQEVVNLSSNTKKDDKKDSRPCTIVLRGSDYYYCKIRAKELKAEGYGNGGISDFLSYLMENDKTSHTKETIKANRMLELENE